jgi:outer membrane lipoprotein carrier protein
MLEHASADAVVHFYIKLLMRFFATLVGFGFLALVLVPPTGAADSVDVHAVAQAVDAHYNHLQSLEVPFTETYRGDGAERVESGTLWLKKPGKMRWEYRSPREKLFVSDGKNAWFYVPGDRQVRKTPVRKLDDLRSPLAFLLGKTKLEKELDGLSLARDIAPLVPGDTVLRGIPKSMADRVSQVILEVAPGDWFRRIVVEEVDGSQTEFTFRDPKENVQIADSEFRFTPPAGVETIAGEFGK